MISIPNTQIQENLTPTATESGKKDVVFTLRLSPEINAQLVAEAEAHRRSRHSHIVFLLERHLQRKINQTEKKP